MEDLTPSQHNLPVEDRDERSLDPRPSATFSNARGFTVEQSQFMNVQGDVHINPAAPVRSFPEQRFSEGRGQSTEPTHLAHETYSARDLYCSQLWHQQRGFPLYVPEPQRNLPPEYRTKGVDIGDVGMVTTEGIWLFFFNIFVPGDHSINRGLVPQDFRPLQLYRPEDILDHNYAPGDCVVSSSVQVGSPDVYFENFPGGEFLFTCKGPKGAILALPEGSSLRKLSNQERMRQHAIQNAESWYTYIQDPNGRGCTIGNGGLYLITGCEKSFEGGIATFQRPAAGNDFHLVFRPFEDQQLTYKYLFNRNTPAVTKTFLAPVQANDRPRTLNNTIFLHGFTVSLGHGVWGRLLGRVGICDIQGPQNTGDSYNPLGSPSSRSSFFSFDLSFLTGGTSRGKRHRDIDDEPVITAELTAASKIVHPSLIINEYILQKVPDATVVITHDDVWSDILRRDGNTGVTVPNSPDFIRQISQHFDIEESDGAAYLVAAKSKPVLHGDGIHSEEVNMQTTRTTFESLTRSVPGQNDHLYIGLSAPLDPQTMPPPPLDPSAPYDHQILAPEEQNRVAGENEADSDMMYTTNLLASFAFGPATEPPPPASPAGSIGSLDELDEDEIRRRAWADDTPRQSLTSTGIRERDLRTPAVHYAPASAPRSDAASHYTFSTSSGASSSASRSGSHSRTTSNSTTHTSLDDFGSLTFNPIHHHPTLLLDVEFDSEEELSEEYEYIEVSSARGAGSIDYAAFEHQMYADRTSSRKPSLPMAIPGSSDDASSIMLNQEHEREGSLATLRPPSRSLDDQVSILSLGVGHPNSPTSISVPESDGDWRSLFTRSAAAIASPSSPLATLPTLAALSGGDGGGFENFGFDLDWDAMKNGITTLDMRNIAVYSGTSNARASTSSGRGPSQLSLMLRRPSTASGGSIMQDPHTYAMVVRGWGGEEYERQRKYWTFRKDMADGRNAYAISGAKQGIEISALGGGDNEKRDAEGDKPKSGPVMGQLYGMALNSEEIWSSALVGSFKVQRIEVRPQKPQQCVIIAPFRGPYTFGPKPPHDGPYMNVHKHSKVMAFSIHRHYKPMRGAAVADDPVDAGGSVSGANENENRTSNVRVRVGGRHRKGQRRAAAMILLAPRHVQEAYTSTNTTKELRSHGLLDEGRERKLDARSSGRERDREDAKRREMEIERQRRYDGGKSNNRRDSSKHQQQLQQSGGTDSTKSTASTPPIAGIEVNAAEFSKATFAPSRSRRGSLDLVEDSDLETELLRSRTTHNEAFSTMDTDSIDQMVPAQDARDDNADGMFSRILQRAPPPGRLAGSLHVPPWLMLQSRVKQEERRRRHDVLSNSFEDVGLLPPQKSSGSRMEKTLVTGVDIFAQVPRDALFMLLPLWPGPTDPISERTATRAPHEIPPEQRQYLLVSYKPSDERPLRSRDSESHIRTSSTDAAGSGRGSDILLTSYHISARLVSHQDLQGSGVRMPDEGLAVLGPWHEARLSMPHIATRDYGLLVIGTSASRDSGIEFDPEALVKLGLCIPVPPEPGVEEEPLAELTPIGRAVLEMVWIGCVAVTSFGPAGTST